MIDWIIMGIIFAMIAVLTVYLIRRNRTDKTLEKKSFLGWIIEAIFHIH